MVKYKLLNGVANNLAASFVSPSNLEFLKYIESLPIELIINFEIDLLKKTIIPKEIESDKTKTVLEKYFDWFIDELKKINATIDDIQIVLIKINYKPGSSFARYYTCNVTIKANDKTYTKKRMSSYS
jgi:hypothetical protein